MKNAEPQVKTYSLERSSRGYLTVVPKPTAAELEEFYKNTYYQKTVSATFQQTYSKDELNLTESQNSLALYLIEKFIQGLPKTLLDIGCGEGFFLASSHKKGFKVYGFDYSSFGIEKHNPAMLPYFKRGDLFEEINAQVKAGNRYAVVNLSGILEHVLEPEHLLAQTKKLLLPGGLLRVLVPNDDSVIQRMAQEIGRKDKYWFCPPEHLNYFNTETLPAFLKSEGFDVKTVLSDFPIDYFILNEYSNYVGDGAKGKEAHRTRQRIQRHLAQLPIETQIAFQQVHAQCGLGRDVCAYAVTPKEV